MCRTALPLLVAAMVTSLAATAQPLPNDKLPVIAAGKMTKAPTIDGKIDPQEWREAAATSGVCNQESNLLLPRPTTFFLAWDADHIYLASRTWVMPGYKPRATGRLPHTAEVFDDSMELHFQPLGKNVAGGRTDSSYKFVVNSLGMDGDLMRVSVGQTFRNWGPKFRIASRLTEPGSAPGQGRWLEVELAGSTKDFELSGANRAGDTWKIMLGSNHFPAWTQARIPSSSGYFDPAGYCSIRLVENTPTVQVTMDDLEGACSGTAAVKITAYNPTDKPVTLKGLLQWGQFADGKTVQEVLKDEPALTVEPGKTAEFTLKKKLPNLGGNTGSIYYRVMQGEQELYRYFVWFKPGTPLPSFTPPPEAFPLQLSANPMRNTLQLIGDAYYLPDPDAAKAMRYRVTKQGQDQPVAEGTIDGAQTCFFRRLVQLPPLTEGDYKVQTTLLDKAGKELGTVSGSFTKLNEAKAFPEWWNNKLGDTERIIKPFEPITRTGNTVTVWGRSYKLGALGLPQEIVSQKTGMLAEPARIVAVIGGKEHRIPIEGDLKITQDKPWRLSFEGQAKGAALVITSKGWIEQDGLVYLELTYGPDGKEPVTVDALRLEFPLDAQQAQALLCIGPGGNYSTRTTMLLPSDKQGRLWGTLDLGRMGSGMAVGSFFPCVWLGNEERGMLWWGDNDKGWLPDDEISAHEVFRDGKTVVLRNNIIGKKATLSGGRTIAFGYNASPFRPMPRNWRRTMGSWDSTFSGGPDVDGIGYKARKDPTSGAITDGWDWLTPPSTKPDEWPAIWAQYKSRADAKVQSLLWTDPQGARNGYYVHTSLASTGYGWKSPDTRVTGYFAAEWGAQEGYVPSNTDYYLYLINRAFTEGGLRTIYWDVLFPQEHRTIQNGMAYELPDGRVQPGYAGFNTRRFLMRVYALADEKGLTPGMQVCHNTNAYLLVGLPWVDALLDGEFHKLTDNSTMDWVDGYPLDRMRAMSVAPMWGTAISWMDHIMVNDPTKQALMRRGLVDYVRLYDSWAGPSTGAPPQSAMEFGLLDSGVQYVPFWRNPYVTSDEDILVSAWKSGDRIILSAFNYGKQAKDVQLKLDLRALGLAGELGGCDLALPPGDAATQFDLGKSVVTLPKLAGHTGRMVGIRATDKAALAKAAAVYGELAKLMGSAQPGAALPASLLDQGMVTPQTQYQPVGSVTEVTCDDKDIKLSAWRLADRMVLFVHNGSAGGKGITLKLDLEKLGLMPKVAWQEFIHASGGTIDVHSKTLRVQDLPANGGRMVFIRRF